MADKITLTLAGKQGRKAAITIDVHRIIYFKEVAAERHGGNTFIAIDSGEKIVVEEKLEQIIRIIDDKEPMMKNDEFSDN